MGLRHLLVLGFPLITLLLESLHLALEVSGLDVGLSESMGGMLAHFTQKSGLMVIVYIG